MEQAQISVGQKPARSAPCTKSPILSIMFFPFPSFRSFVKERKGKKKTKKKKTKKKKKREE
jgi:hypothetical protein